MGVKDGCQKEEASPSHPANEKKQAAGLPQGRSRDLVRRGGKETNNDSRAGPIRLLYN